MDYIELIKRAFSITAKYRALWIFGFFLALCGGGGASGGGNFSPPTGQGGDMPFDTLPSMPDPQLIIGIAIAVILLVICLTLLGVVIVQVTRTALIAMVNRIEENGTTSFREGWSLGWSYRAVSLFLVSLTIAVPIFLAMTILFLCAASPFLLLLSGSEPLMVLGGISGGGLLIGFIFLAIAVGVVATPFYELAWRYTVLKDLGPVNSVTATYRLIRQQLKEVFVVVILFIALGIGWAVISIILGIVVLIVGGIIGAGPGYLAYTLTENVFIGLGVGVPILLITVVLPMTFLQGLYLVFQSTLWTLIFRQLIDPATPQPAPTPQPEPPASPTTPQPEVADSADESADDITPPADPIEEKTPLSSEEVPVDEPASDTPSAEADETPPADSADSADSSETETLSGEIVTDDDADESQKPPTSPPTA